MPGAPVIAGASFAAGLRSEFLSTYRRMEREKRELLSRVMRLDIPSTRRTEDYFFWESAPHIRIWLRGETMTSKAFKGVKFSITNYRWAHAIEWYNEDLQDDQTKSLLDHARGLGRSAAILDERVFFQLIRQATDLDLLQTLPNAPDGAAIFATTAAGSARFGATNGNLLTGSGVAAAADIRTDYWAAVEQFKLFQDTEGQPLFDDDITDGAFVVVYNAANEQVFAEAFLREIIQGSSAGVSDEIRAAGKTPQLWSTQRITDNDWFVVAAGAEVKPVFSQLREGMSEVIATMQNSDTARATGLESIRFKKRKGFGVSTPYAGIQINN